MKWILFISITLLAVVSGCGHFPGAPDSGGTENRPPQTQILKAYAVPDTVAPGDTARFVCVIKDSTDNRFKFLWYIGQGKVLDAEYSNTYNGYVSNTNTIKVGSKNSFFLF